MWTHRVLLESIVRAPEKPMYKWYCMASEDCKANHATEHLGKIKSISNACNHLVNAHNLESQRSSTMSAKKENKSKAVNLIKESNIFKTDEIKALDFAYT